MQRCQKVRCHPALEKFARERFEADVWDLDPSMKPDRIEATAFGYAEHIECTIGIVTYPPPKT